MKIVENAKLIESLNWRYATKKFDAAKKISSSDWKVIEDALVLTPSSYGLQPWKFIVIQNQAIKEQLVPASYGQKQVAECSHLLVLAGLVSVDTSYVDRFLETTAATQGKKIEDLAGFKGMLVKNIVDGNQIKNIFEWSARQCYIALGNAMTVAAVMGVDSCPMEGLDPKKYDEVLNLADTSYKTVVALPFGYRDASDKYANSPKVRFKASELVHHI
ncbi:MAG: NAD(P)H-dependent oxidoreductase [Bacteriovoracaceae bacterium]